MKLILEEIRFLNFMSFGNSWTTINLLSHQTTLVIGANGNGKSAALLDTICFALFNRPFRNINKPTLANTITKAPCIVELDFNVNGTPYMVRRGLRPTLFEIYKNDQLITEAANSRDYQEAFEKYVLKINHKTFCQVVILGSAIFSPFMTMTAQARRDVIEDLLDLKIFTSMNTILKTQISETDIEIYKQQQEKRILEEKINLTNQHLKQLQESNDQLINDKKILIIDIDLKLSDVNDKIDELNKLNLELSSNTKEFKTLSTKMSQLTKVQHQLQHKVQQIQKDIKFLEDNTTCPTCAQDITEFYKTTSIKDKNQEQQKVDDALATLSQRQEDVQLQIDVINNIQVKIQENSHKIIEFNNSIKFYISNKKIIENDIKKLETKDDFDISKLEEWNNDLIKTQNTLIDMQNNRMVMGYAANVLKDSGIKSVIIKTYIPIINQLIQKYLAVLDFFVEFHIDEQFKEHIKSRYRDTFQYTNFSQGERMRIDLSILFTWRALAKLRGSISCNLLVFDEILDGSLDSAGIEDFLKLIGNEKDTNIFVISHRENINEERFDRILKIDKHKNFSQIVGVNDGLL